jgi:hypothetical protein
VTKSVLASEIYGIVRGVNIAIAIGITITIITDQLKLSKILTIVYTDLYSLYKCLIKLRTITEKRLMINIIALRQLYKRRELIKIR